VNVLQRNGVPPGNGGPGPKALLNGRRPGSPGSGNDAAIRLTEISKVYGRGPGAVHAVDRLSLTVRDGEFVCLVGASGCGKSTLLSIVAGLDTPTAGGSTPPGAGSRSCSRNPRCSRG
jgi:ABC-type glutathione transport system ATPase component